jgi:hypothetical protein
MTNYIIDTQARSPGDRYIMSMVTGVKGDSDRSAKAQWIR